ncbi:MAG: GAF domain-containing protein [Flavobacteriales bacterium]|nr:GAF domain-containing protein [Flavobacteriales bacterium]
MAEQLVIPETTDRATLYTALFPQVKALLVGENDPIAAMANFCAAVHHVFHWHWVGFYRVQEGQLVVGPFQGPIACSPIGHGKGVCGVAWKEARIINVPDVDAFPGHIACSAASRSEIVLPLHGRGGVVSAVFDVDSAVLNDFGPADERGLAQLCSLIEAILP